MVNGGGGSLHKLDLSTSQLYYSDNWQVLEERRGDGAPLEQYVWSPVYVDAMIERDRDTAVDGTLGERLYALQDANYNVTALVDTSGNVVERYQYDPYGKVTVLNADWSTTSEDGLSDVNWSYLHQGGRYDSVVNLYSFRNREFAPSIGRWAQQDPLGYPEGANRYQWESSNTASRLDPSGLWSLYKWIYTSDGNASDEVYSAALDAGAQGANDGFFAAANGAALFGRPFDDSYFYDPCDEMLKYSEALGGIARDALLAAAIPNLQALAESPLAYELGQTTLTDEMFVLLQDLDAASRGRYLAQEAGGALKMAGQVAIGTFKDAGRISGTLGTGPTPVFKLGVLIGTSELDKAIKGSNGPCYCR